MRRKGKDERALTVRDVATVTVSEPVKARRKAPRKGSRNGAVQTVVKVDARVMAAARQALRPGERLVIVDGGRVVTTYA